MKNLENIFKIKSLSYSKSTKLPNYKHIKISYKTLKTYSLAGFGTATGLAGIIVTILAFKEVVGVTVATIIGITLSGIGIATTWASIKEGSSKHGLIIHLKRIKRTYTKQGKKHTFYTYTPYKRLTKY